MPFQSCVEFPIVASSEHALRRFENDASSSDNIEFVSISGLLSTMNLPELLQWVKFGQKTGTGIFERHGIVKKIFFDQGLIVSASSNNPREYLGQILLCFGWIDEEKLNEAFKQQKTTKKLLGRILNEAFGLSEDQIRKALRIKIEETVYDLFLWEDGKFVYQDFALPIPASDRLESPMTIDHVMFEGARRSDEWKEFRKTFPTDEVVFKKKDASKSLEGFTKDFLVLRVYDSIDGERNIQDVLLETRVPEFRAYEAFAKLFWADFIEPIKKSVMKIQAKEVAGVPDLLKSAADFFKQKNFDRSFQHIEEFLMNNPGHQEAMTLFNLVKEAFMKDLFAACPPDATPELAVDISDLNEKIYSSKEGFIASRVNGQWDVKSLIMISPLGELESLKILKRLKDEGVIKMRA
jgi:hypothetical protein